MTTKVIISRQPYSTSAQGEIAVIEGDNSITMTNCTMTSGSSEHGLLMMQSGSGDASGVNPVMTITGTSLTMTDSSAPLLEVATCVNATCTLDNITETVGIQQASFDENNSSEIYNLQGHRVKTPQKGIFIRDGKKWVVR